MFDADTPVNRTRDLKQSRGVSPRSSHSGPTRPGSVNHFGVAR